LATKPFRVADVVDGGEKGYDLDRDVDPAARLAQTRDEQRGGAGQLQRTRGDLDFASEWLEAIGHQGVEESPLREVRQSFDSDNRRKRPGSAVLVHFRLPSPGDVQA